MKILLCGDSLGIGGAETHLVQLSLALAKRGHSVTVAAEYGELCPSLFAGRSGIVFHALSLKGDKFPRGVARLRSIIKNGGFQIVHAHSRPAALAVAIVKLSLPFCSFGFTVTAHAKYSSHPIKKLLTVTGDSCIAVSDDIRRHLISDFGTDPDRITVIPNGIDTARFSPTPAQHVPNGTFNILFASRLDSDCSLGAEFLCSLAPRLCKLIPHLTVTIAGGGDDLLRITRLADTANHLLGRRCITVMGTVISMEELIAKCHLAVGVSRFALEALACEKNVILFGNEGALGLFEDGVIDLAVSTNFTARGFQNPDSELLYREIARLYSMSDKKRRRLCRMGRRLILQNYSGETVVGLTEKVYRSQISPPRILLGGYYGLGNLGDETVRKILSSQLKHRIPSASIRTLSGAYGPFEVNRKDPIAVLRALAQSDVYISGGGSLFQNSTSLLSLIYYCALISLARLLGCRIIIAANGIGPLKGGTAKALAGAAIMKAHYASFRDPESVILARRLTAEKKQIFLSADPAFCLPFFPSREGDRVLALSLRQSEAEDPFVAEAIRILSKELCLDPCYFPMDVHLDQSSVAPQLCRSELSAKLCRSYGAVGSRLHFIIFAILSGLPFAPLGTDPKLDSLCRATLCLPSINVAAFPSPRSLAREMGRYLSISRNTDLRPFINRCRQLFLFDVDRIAALCGAEILNEYSAKTLEIQRTF